MAITVEIKVVPSAGRSMCKLDARDRLKCYLKSPPEKGKANNELIALLAKALGVARNQVSIVSGQTNRTKRVRIDADYSFAQLLSALGIEKQLGLFE